MAAPRTGPYDLLIVGAGPAGATAALRARTHGLSVLLVEKSEFPRALACAGWMGPAGVKLCGECGLSAEAAKASRFDKFRLYSWDLKRSAEISEKDCFGWLVDRSTFDHGLLKKAIEAGAEARFGFAADAVTLRDKEIEVGLSDGSREHGRLLLIGDGVHSSTARLANMLAAGQLARIPQCYFVEFVGDKPETSLSVVIGGTRQGQIVTVARIGLLVRVSLLSLSPSSSACDQLIGFCEAARKSGMLPSTPSVAPVSRVSPAGVALDLDSHVGKRCVLIGDAGGFVSAFSNEGIYPAMKSGWIAADRAAHALDSPLVQDDLSNFSNDWRTELADYLRMPNTDLSLLLPLVFSNPQMTARVARAFLLGQQF